MNVEDFISGRQGIEMVVQSPLTEQGQPSRMVTPLREELGQ